MDWDVSVWAPNHDALTFYLSERVHTERYPRKEPKAWTAPALQKEIKPKLRHDWPVLRIYRRIARIKNRTGPWFSIEGFKASSIRPNPGYLVRSFPPPWHFESILAFAAGVFAGLRHLNGRRLASGNSTCSRAAPEQAYQVSNIPSMIKGVSRPSGTAWYHVLAGRREIQILLIFTCWIFE